jgi:peptide/nickel transport system substrate-binding protein
MLRTIASQSKVNTLLKSIPLYRYNVAKAKQELAESAYPKGFSTTLLEYNTGLVQVAEVVASELQKIGIHAKVKEDTINAWTATETGPHSGRQPAVSFFGCLDPDPSWYTVILGSKNTQIGQWNIADYAPPAVDQLINAGIATSNPAKRFAIYSKLVKRLAADVPYLSLYVEDSTVALSDKFTFHGYNAWSSLVDEALGIRKST